MVYIHIHGPTVAAQQSCTTMTEDLAIAGSQVWRIHIEERTHLSCLYRSASHSLVSRCLTQGIPLSYQLICIYDVHQFSFSFLQNAERYDLEPGLWLWKNPWHHCKQDLLPFG